MTTAVGRPSATPGAAPADGPRGVTPDRSIAVVVSNCPDRVPAVPTETTVHDAYRLFLVRSGCFHYRDGRGRVLADTATAVLRPPHLGGDASHPAGGGDAFTQIFIDAQAWSELAGDTARVPLQAHVSPAMQIAHRRLLAATQRDHDELEAHEQLTLLLASALAPREPRRTRPCGPSTARHRRELVEDAKTLLAAAPTEATLTGIAAQLTCSPHHLSRTFRELTGRTLSEHRQELRFALAIEQLAAGPSTGSLADVAARCGYSDHAHLTRTVRRYLGTTAAAVRAELTRRVGRDDQPAVAPVVADLTP